MGDFTTLAATAGDDDDATRATLGGVPLLLDADVVAGGGVRVDEEDDDAGGDEVAELVAAPCEKLDAPATGGRGGENAAVIPPGGSKPPVLAVEVDGALKSNCDENLNVGAVAAVDAAVVVD